MGLVPGARGAHGHIARLDDRFERAFLVPGVALHGFHEVGDQVIAALQLNVNIRPGVVALDFQPHQAVVHPDRKYDDQNEQAQNDYAGHRTTSRMMEYLPTAHSSFHCSQYTWRFSGCKVQAARHAHQKAMEAGNSHG